MGMLDYEVSSSKPRAGSGRKIFWLIFFGASLVGLILSNIFDDILENAYLGHHASGEMMPLLALGIPFAGLVALAARLTRRRDRIGWEYAAALGLLGPIVALVAIIALF